jgi:uncharacterized membrane protein YphA (DoxX/SURF4 family)
MLEKLSGSLSRSSSNSSFIDEKRTAIERLGRSGAGRAVIVLVRCMLVFTLFEDGCRVLLNGEQQATLLAKGMFADYREPRAKGDSFDDWKAKKAAARAAFDGKRDLLGHGLRALGLGQVLGAAGVVASRDPSRAAAAMAAVVALNLATFATFVDASAHIHGVASFVCRGSGSLGGLAALVAHARSERVGKESSSLEASDAHVAARRTSDRVILAARVLLAPYFLASGLFHGAGAASAAAGVGGAAALVAGFSFDNAALLLLALLVVHGLGGYAALLHHHTKHRDALLYAFAQDLSVLGALALLRLTGPGGLSVDARRAKRE